MRIGFVGVGTVETLVAPRPVAAGQPFVRDQRLEATAGVELRAEAKQ